MKYFLLVYLLTLLPLHGQGQGNGLMRFDTRTRQLTRLPAVPVDASVSAARTMHSFGCLGASNTVILPQSLPIANILPGTQFAQRVRAASRFEGLSFPGRTAVSLQIWDNGVLGRASGTLIGERFILTAAHNVVDFSSFQFNGDSLLVEPGFDNGRQSLLPAAWAYRFYVPAEYYQARNLDFDVAIIELAQPIGQGAGWMGFGYNTDTTQVKNGVWHKFSYPGRDVVVAPNRYNSDTLFYEYGRVFTWPNSSSLQVPNHADGASGQSGSSFFRTDNRSYWTIYAVTSTFYNFTHASIGRPYFAAFQKIILDNPAPPAQSFEIYPNPVSSQASLQLPICAFGPVHIEMFDMLGRSVHQLNYPRSGGIINLDLRSLTSGIYFLRVQAGSEHLTRRLVKTN